MKVVYTCPECGADLEEVVLTSYPPQRRVYCPKCKWSHTERQPEDQDVVRIPYTVEKSNPIPSSSDKFTYGSLLYVPPACRDCSNHPSNGGSGVCHCTLGSVHTT